MLSFLRLTADLRLKRRRVSSLQGRVQSGRSQPGDKPRLSQTEAAVPHTLTTPWEQCWAQGLRCHVAHAPAWHTVEPGLPWGQSREGLGGTPAVLALSLPQTQGFGWLLLRGPLWGRPKQPRAPHPQDPCPQDLCGRHPSPVLAFAGSCPGLPTSESGPQCRWLISPCGLLQTHWASRHRLTDFRSHDPMVAQSVQQAQCTCSGV